MKELSLFTGIGGGLLGTHHLLGWHTIGAVEHDEYCCKVLRKRQLDGRLDEFPIWHMDIREFNRRVAERYTGMVDVISAGFPCQPFSVAGKRKGDQDERNMWPATLRAIQIIQPRFALLENVPGLLSSGYFGTILGDLASSGYDARWCVLGADDVGAPHRRKRLWTLAYTDGPRRSQQAAGRDEERDGVINSGEDMAHAERCGSSTQGDAQFNPSAAGNGEQAELSGGRGQVSWWNRDPADDKGEPEPGLGRVAYGIPNRMDRLKAIGNAQVPLVAAETWRILTEDM